MVFSPNLCLLDDTIKSLEKSLKGEKVSETSTAFTHAAKALKSMRLQIQSATLLKI